MSSYKNWIIEKRLLKNGRVLENQKGITIVLVAIMMVVLLGFAALAIDVGYLMVTRNQLQNVADAAALAGARYLGAEYVKLDPSKMSDHEFTREEVLKVIQETATQNKAASKPIYINDDDVIIGLWDVGKYGEDDPYPTLKGPDAVRVIARRDNIENGPISTFLARVVNIDLMNVSSLKAIAALSGPAYVAEGELKTPFGLSENVFPNDCKDVISFSPTTDSCAGWHNFFDAINASAMEDKLLGLIQGDSDCKYCDRPDITLMNGPEWLDTNFEINKSPDPEVTPFTSAGDEFEFQGGTISSLFLGGYLDSKYDGNTGLVLDNAKKPAPMIALFDYFRYRDGDGKDNVWTATIPVYKDDEEGCTNPNTSLEILGFATINVFTTDPPPLSSLEVNVECKFTVIEARGGGGNYGNLKGTIPNLVK